MTSDREKLQGLWYFDTLELEGTALPPTAFASSSIRIDGDRFVSDSGGILYEGTYALDETSRPGKIDITFTAGPEAGGISRGIYEFDGDRWRLCLGLAGRTRPSEFVTSPGSGHALEVLSKTTRATAGGVVPTWQESAADPATLAPDLARAQGSWGMISGTVDGMRLPKEFVKGARRVLDGSALTVTIGGSLLMRANMSVDDTADPHAMDYSITDGPNAGAVQFGIYRWDGEVLTLCFSDPGNTRPDEFTSAKGSKRTLTSWQRVEE